MATIIQKCLHFLLIGLVLLGEGCTPVTFENPVPPPAHPTADESILGTWVTSDDKSEALMAIFPRKSGSLDVVYIMRKKDPSNPDEHVLLFDGYNTEVGHDKLLCLRSRGHAGGQKEFSGYVMATYSVSKDTVLSLKLFSKEKVKGFIKSNELKGKVTKGKYTESVKVTSLGKELRDLISRKGVGAFTGKGKAPRFTRPTKKGSTERPDTPGKK